MDEEALTKRKVKRIEEDGCTGSYVALDDVSSAVELLKEKLSEHMAKSPLSMTDMRRAVMFVNEAFPIFKDS